jgi:uncharacterized protein YcbK (DUF882 family)
MLILPDIITSSNKYPERAKSKELTQAHYQHAQDLCDKVNALFKDLGIDIPKVSSGFRPSSVNANVPGSAKKSLHMTCQAVDLEDPTGSLDKLISSRPELLNKHGLWLEDPAATSTWCHLDISPTRVDRKIRIFKP